MLHMIPIGTYQLGVEPIATGPILSRHIRCNLPGGVVFTIGGFWLTERDVERLKWRMEQVDEFAFPEEFVRQSVVIEVPGSSGYRSGMNGVYRFADMPEFTPKKEK